ncbi:MAG: MATE family efflux transporter [Myxococcales bacterium]
MSDFGSGNPDEAADSLERTAKNAEALLESPNDPEIGPPVPASAVAASALAPKDFVGLPVAGGSAKEILRLAWPVIASQVLLNLTGLIDRMMIGRLAEGGSAAVPLAAVGYATQLFHLIHSTLFAVGLACVALMARAIGSGNTQTARHAFAGSVQVSVCITLVYASGLFFFSEQSLALLGAEESVIKLAAPYLELTVAASLILSFTLIFESGMRANRDMRTPMFIALVVTATKLALNAVLIFGLFGAPRLELLGAGLATAISQAVGFALFILVFMRLPKDAPTALRFRDLFRSNPIVRQVIRIAVPGVAERIVLNMGLLSYFWILSNWYGTMAVAAYTVGISLLSFSWIPGTGYAQACSTVVGQALGARDRDVAVRAGRQSVVLAVGTAIPLGLLFAWFRIPLAEMFTDDVAVIAALSPFMLALAAAQPFLQMHFTLAGAHKGAGDTITPLIGALIGNWAIRVPMAILIGGVLELDVVWIWATLIFDHISRAIWLGYSFLRGRWSELPTKDGVQVIA